MYPNKSNFLHIEIFRLFLLILYSKNKNSAPEIKDYEVFVIKKKLSKINIFEIKCCE